MIDPVQESPTLGIRPSMIFVMAVGTLLGFGGVGALLIIGLQDRDWLQVLLADRSLIFHLVSGIAAGLVIGGIAWALIAQSFMRSVEQKYTTLIGPLMPGAGIRVLVSICAGVGEEIFFRGAIQHWLGIFWTALIFVALHGYLDPRSWRVSVYGALLLIGMVGLGWMARDFGLLAPIVAHTVIDVVLLWRLTAQWRKQHAPIA